MDKTNLYKALELATKPGACLYVYGGKPCCIIGQLFVLEGGKVEDMIKEGGESRWSTVRRVYEDVAPPQLTKYPKNLLITMQARWDAAELTNRKASIKQLINEYKL